MCSPNCLGDGWKGVLVQFSDPCEERPFYAFRKVQVRAKKWLYGGLDVGDSCASLLQDGFRLN
jgi:hypothetical protein